jgi:hypothetical protein
MHDPNTPEPTPDLTMFTVEEASRWLTCPQPVPMALLQRLGKDCSMVSCLHKQPTGSKPTPEKRWPSERTYTADVIRLVFKTCPDTAPYLPATPGASA